MITDSDRERRLAEDAIALIAPGSSSVVRPAGNRDGVQMIVASRDSETGSTSAVSTQVVRAAVIKLVRSLCEDAGLPEPWAGQKVR